MKKTGLRHMQKVTNGHYAGADKDRKKPKITKNQPRLTITPPTPEYISSYADMAPVMGDYNPDDHSHTHSHSLQTAPKKDTIVTPKHLKRLPTISENPAADY